MVIKPDHDRYWGSTLKTGLNGPPYLCKTQPKWINVLNFEVESNRIYLDVYYIDMNQTYKFVFIFRTGSNVIVV